MSYLDSLHAGKRARLLKLAAAGAAARPGPPAASVASALSPADAARLRVRAQALSDENASLRRNLQSLAQQAKRAETELAALRSRAQQRERHAAEQHAEQHAALEEQAQRQQRALLDLARTAGGVARENVELHARLAALQVHWRGWLAAQLGAISAPRHQTPLPRMPPPPSACRRTRTTAAAAARRRCRGGWRSCRGCAWSWTGRAPPVVLRAQPTQLNRRGTPAGSRRSCSSA